MYKYNRSEHFRTRNYGAFLNSALSKYNSFKGIEGFATATDEGTPAVDMDPDKTRQDQEDGIRKNTTTALYTLHPNPAVLQHQIPGGLGRDGTMVPEHVPHNTHAST